MSIGYEFETVLGAAQVGAEWAFETLYRGLNPRLVRYLSVQAPSAADDIAAETWLAAARQLQSFSGDERAFRAWMFTIARRRLIQHWRTAGRRPAVPLPPERFHDRAAPDQPEAEGLAAVSAHEVVATIASLLPPDQTDVVLLRVLAGLDVNQVARLLGKRPGTVRVLQHKALGRLAEKFSNAVLTEKTFGAIGKPR